MMKYPNHWDIGQRCCWRTGIGNRRCRGGNWSPSAQGDWIVGLRRHGHTADNDRRHCGGSNWRHGDWTHGIVGQGYPRRTASAYRRHCGTKWRHRHESNRIVYEGSHSLHTRLHRKRRYNHRCWSQCRDKRSLNIKDCRGLADWRRGGCCSQDSIREHLTRFRKLWIVSSRSTMSILWYRHC
jgi:hypothetical protein